MALCESVECDQHWKLPLVECLPSSFFMLYVIMAVFMLLMQKLF